MKDPAFHPGFKVLWRWPNYAHGPNVKVWWILALWDLFQLGLTHTVETDYEYSEWALTCYLPFGQRLSLCWRYR